ncbi:type IX secretion system motor protein PorM/GldM [Pedobacter montanisoli]|uniref:Gliding motility protein GldM n=1 Tax=Pedobacter montanisoli TaxID=2923277 RepID=A0ABS9ZSU4_9SPHI|nr:gliding motility protein GldM [Pedobacter montanisoli]MCJ0741307.1 gliding motility protein GldM [Pedobacter montanisoli]
MAGGKETARQKMIGIMYLVLLAMLALNVSDLVLKAFKNINDSLNTSKENVNTSIQQLLRNYGDTKAKESSDNQVKFERAKKAQTIAGNLIKYIDGLQAEIAKDGIDENGELVQKNNLDIGQNIMGSDEQPKKGKELQEKINQTGKELAALLLPDEGKPTFVLEAKNPEKPKAGEPKTWTGTNFGEGVPLAAFRTILTMLQNNTKNMEADIINKILADKPIVVLDHFEAVAVAPTSYVIQGQPYKAEIYLTASDSKSTPDISVNGSKVPTENGKGVYTGGTGSVGTFTWKGTIRVKERNGNIKTYETAPQTYQVAAPSATVSSDKLNVIYAGIPNPFTISAAGFPNINASISGGGSLTGANGKFMVNVPGSLVGKEVSISVSASNNGKTVNLGAPTFRVKAIPAPVAKVGGNGGGDIASVQLKSESEIEADLDDFPFDVKFRILRYELTVIKPRSDAVTISGQGGSFTGAIRNAINAVSPGTRVIFDQIVSQGPDGRQRVLPPVVFNVK